MTRTLELSPEMEERLQEIAAARGATPEAVALQVLEDGLRTAQTPEQERARRHAIIARLHGALEGGRGSVDELLRERRAEAEREEAKHQESLRLRGQAVAP